MAPSIRMAGICCDHNSSYLRGCAGAPARIRHCLHCGSANLTAENGVHLNDIDLIDCGDFTPEQTEEGYLAIEKTCRQMMDGGAIPLILGGDHSISYPVIRALAGIRGGFKVLHFDAHADLYSSFGGNCYSHACPFTRILEEGLIERLIQVGIRTLNRPQLERATQFGVEIHEMRTFAPQNITLDRATPVYISFDMDVLDPAFAPGVSHHEPGGMSVREVLHIIQNLPCPIIGADLVEYNPSRDINDMTGMVAAKLVKEIAGKIVENWSGTGSSAPTR